MEKCAAGERTGFPQNPRKTRSDEPEEESALLNPRGLGTFGAPGAHCITIRGDQGHRALGQSMW